MCVMAEEGPSKLHLSDITALTNTAGITTSRQEK